MSYESGGNETTIEYVIDAKSISDLVARVGEVEHVANAGNLLVTQINGARRSRSSGPPSAAVQARTDVQAAEQQAATEEVIIANDEATDAEQLSLRPGCHNPGGGVGHLRPGPSTT